MPGSVDESVARENRRLARRLLAFVLAAVVVIVVCAASAIYILQRPAQFDAGESPAMIAPTSPLAVPPATTTTLSVAPQPPQLPHDFVAQALPTRIVVSKGDEVIVDTSSVTGSKRKWQPDGNFYLGFPPGDPVIVINDSQAPWAVLPGSDAPKQAMLMGHANRDPPMVFNALSLMDTSEDMSDVKLVATLPDGTLTSEFVRSHPIPKDDLFVWMQSAEFPPGTTLVIMCQLDVRTGQPLNTDDAAAWEFALQSSQAHR